MQICITRKPVRSRLGSPGSSCPKGLAPLLWPWRCLCRRGHTVTSTRSFKTGSSKSLILPIEEQSSSRQPRRWRAREIHVLRHAPLRAFQLPEVAAWRESLDSEKPPLPTIPEDDPAGAIEVIDALSPSRDLQSHDLGFTLSLLDAAFRAAVMESLETGAPAGLSSRSFLSDPESVQWSRFCAGVLRDGSLHFQAFLGAGRTLEIEIERQDAPTGEFGISVQAADITRRKQAEKCAEERLAAALEALRLSEERYRAAFQMSLDCISLNRLSDGMFIECNKAFLDLMGYSRDEVVGRTSVELNIWASLDDRQRLVQILRQEGACRNLEAQFLKKNGETLWGLMSASLLELEGEPCILCITKDISDTKLAEDRIRHLAFHDALTELPNRRLVLERLRQSVNAGKRSGRQRALLFVDLDNFKTLNDTLGYHAGDYLLKEVARRLTDCIGPIDTAARVGGDEFVVILEDLSQIPEEAASDAKAAAQKILASIDQPFVLPDRECHCSSSIGITIFRDADSETSQILQQADIAMHQAKAAGRDAIRFFAPELQAAVNARAALEDEVRQGIRNHQFVLWYQPQIDHGRVIGAEALLRWNHPNRGILPPSEFIALAEETGLIVPLGKQVLEAACSQLAAWAAHPRASALSIAVNVSARQFRQTDFVDQALAALASSGADPRLLKLEITESMLVDNFEQTAAIMTALKARGVQFSLDDFGTGYSSLSYLKRLPLDQLKIDRSFVRDMLTDPVNSAITRAIVSLSRAMDLSLLAEGVETEEQRACLDLLGCHAYQGYLFSPPVPLEKFQLLLAANSQSA